MNTTFEPPQGELDFGNKATLRVSAYHPEDLFQLGRLCERLQLHNIEFVFGTTEDGLGKYLRFPLNDR